MSVVKLVILLTSVAAKNSAIADRWTVRVVCDGRDTSSYRTTPRPLIHVQSFSTWLHIQSDRQLAQRTSCTVDTATTYFRLLSAWIDYIQPESPSHYDELRESRRRSEGRATRAVRHRFCERSEHAELHI